MPPPGALNCCESWLQNDLPNRVQPTAAVVADSGRCDRGPLRLKRRVGLTTQEIPITAMTTSAVARFLDRFTEWAIAQPPIEAAALVGSHARGTATADSDLDLVILVQEPEQFLKERTWVRTFGEPLIETLEDYGLLKSIRVRYSDLEVEFGIACVEWPLDIGSRQVINDGMQVLFERRPVLSSHL